MEEGNRTGSEQADGPGLPAHGLRIAFAAALGSLPHAILFYERSSLFFYRDYLLILFYFALFHAVLVSILAMPALVLMRRNLRGLDLLPAVALAFTMFVHPLSRFASDLYLSSRLEVALDMAPRLGKLSAWAFATVLAAYVFRSAGSYASSARRRWIVSGALLIAIHLGYLRVCNPLWRVPEGYDPAFHSYPDPVSPEPSGPVLALCIDGADWEVVDPMLREGRLPHLAGIVESGVRAEIHGCPPYSSHASWMSIFTGKTSARHGIQGHLVLSLPGVSLFPLDYRDRDNLPLYAVGSLLLDWGILEAPPVPGTFLRAKPLWKVLSDHGRTVWILGMPATWPAYPVNGVMMTDRMYYSVWETFFRHREKIDGAAFPPSLIAEIRDVNRKPTEVTAEEVGRFYSPTEEDMEVLREDDIGIRRHGKRVHFNRTYCMDRTVLDVFDRLSERERIPDLAVLYLTGSDFAAHAFYPYKFPERYPAGFSTAEEIAQFRGVIDRYWEYLDERIGRILRRYGDRATVMVLSDHGNECSPHHPLWPAWHSREGIFVLRGPGLRKGISVEPLALYDVAPTLYRICGFPSPDDADGRVRSDLFEMPPPEHRIATYDADGPGR